MKTAGASTLMLSALRNCWKRIISAGRLHCNIMGERRKRSTIVDSAVYIQNAPKWNWHYNWSSAIWVGRIQQSDSKRRTRCVCSQLWTTITAVARTDCMHYSTLTTPVTAGNRSFCEWRSRYIVMKDVWTRMKQGRQEAWRNTANPDWRFTGSISKSTSFLLSVNNDSVNNIGLDPVEISDLKITSNCAWRIKLNSNKCPGWNLRSSIRCFIENTDFFLLKLTP